MIQFNHNISTGRECPYCGNKPEYVKRKKALKSGNGFIYHCPPCNAYVGVHAGYTKRALGRLANKELRLAKMKAHFYFDQLWQRAIDDGRSRSESRRNAYKWLSKELNTPRRYTHIGMFDLELCKKVVEVCLPYCPIKRYPYSI